MTLLRDRTWAPTYDTGGGDLARRFWLPALRTAVRYDRTSGYFKAGALALAARGVEELIRHGGRMRLIVGCTLDEAEARAIDEGATLGEVLARKPMPLAAESEGEQSALELLAWMVAGDHLQVRIALPCDPVNRRPVEGDTAIFHAKQGVIEDRTGARIAFSGSINETPAGWLRNWESIHVYASWEMPGHVEAVEQAFDKLWTDQDPRARVIEVPEALRSAMLHFLPPDGAKPARLIDQPKLPNEPELEAAERPAPDGTNEPEPIKGPGLSDDPPKPFYDLRREVWSYIAGAAAIPGEAGKLVGEATSAVTPWPHQRRAFDRMWNHWPPRLLIADEVGLGKTIQAGLLLRQAWLSGRAKRILVMAPKAVLRQWQIELREKFALSWPIYDGQKLVWYPSPGRFGDCERLVSRQDWHKEPVVLVSSHLLRRRDRAPELLEQAQPWDLIVLDEAHHARREGSDPNKDSPNRLLALMRRLVGRTKGLVLLTATPMQVHPIEVYDLLALFGLPYEWTKDAFLGFFELAGQSLPSVDALRRLAPLFQAIERDYGAGAETDVLPLVGGSRIRARRILAALRETRGDRPFHLLAPEDRRAAARLAMQHTPVRRLVSRNTRSTLMRYQAAGQLDTRIAKRDVVDRFVELSPAERIVYGAVEDYITEAWKNAASHLDKGKANAVGFVLTIYRRRLASSFAALAKTLQGRLASGQQVTEEDVEDEEDSDETQVLDPVAAEKDAIRDLLVQVKALPTDTKANKLVEELGLLDQDGFRQAVVFTQYTDTLDFLRDHLAKRIEGGVICFSGRGGEVATPTGWKTIGREETKRRFKAGEARILLCTDAAAEGLNFQFCGALINYDMPWNPMRVEQRIGRIDRLGQAFDNVRIVNLHYADTIETDVYMALRQRIGLFTQFVGKLQPILAKLPELIRERSLTGRGDSQELAAELTQEAATLRESGFDLDELAETEPLAAPSGTPALALADLAKILHQPNLLPHDLEATRVNRSQTKLMVAGRLHPINVTTDSAFYDLHAESCELFTPGSPIFPEAEPADTGKSSEWFRSTISRSC